MNDCATSTILAETPVTSTASDAAWGSDAIALMLHALDIEYLALNPGASYRGLHDSLVNYLGNRSPQMLLCLHEESAVAIAHGYAKAADRMMGAVLHSNVGLMHASMAIFNAWCDRVPMLLIGATGPWDAAKRRPWIDWIHTSADQGALVRDYTKWDNQPASVTAAYEALLRAAQIANTAPRGPTYVNLDCAIQEAELDAVPPLPEAGRYRAPDAVLPSPALVRQAAELLSGAKNPFVLAGRGSRRMEAWNNRVRLAEKLDAGVLTDLKSPAGFPTDHPLHAAPPGFFLPPSAAKRLREADVVLALDWMDLSGTLKQAFGTDPISAKIINVSPDAHSHRGWSMDYQALPPVDVYMLCEPEAAVPLLIEACRARTPRTAAPPQTESAKNSQRDVMSIGAVAEALDRASAGIDLCLARLPLGWNGDYRHFRHPLDFLGFDGGGGVGSGPGLTIGAALALRGTGRVTAGIIGDGDFLMAATALWTAVHYRIPCLFVICNNGSFYNDELHQERMAIERSRPVENKWIGQRIDDPAIDLAALARAQGAHGIGPVTSVSALQPAIAQGLKLVREGGVCVIDVRVPPGYDAPMSGAPAVHAR